MIFENDSLVFEFLEAFELDQGNTRRHDTCRNFDALSFRIESDAVIKTPTRTLRLQTDDIAYFPANVNYTRVSGKDHLIVVHFKCYNYHANEIESFTPADTGKYRALFDSLLAACAEKGPGYRHVCSALLSTVFAEAYRDNYKGVSVSPLIKPAVDYINANYLLPDISVASLAKRSLISEVYFRKLFREAFGTSPKDYILTLKLNHAASLIETGYYTVSEVAAACGFRDNKHFSVSFKKRLGVSPSLYKYNFSRDSAAR